MPMLSVCRKVVNITPPFGSPLLLQGIVSIVERSAISSSGHSRAIDIGASIFLSRSDVDLIGNTIVRGRVQPDNVRIGQNVAAPECIDVIDSMVDHIAIARHHNDRSQILEYVRVENSHQVHGSAVEGVCAAANKVAVADQGHELAGFVLGEKEGIHGGVLDLHAVGQSTGFVEESVDGIDVDVPLVDGCFGIVLRRIVGDGVDHADVGGLAAVVGGGSCCGSCDDGSEGQDLGCSGKMHLDLMGRLGTWRQENWS